MRSSDRVLWNRESELLRQVVASKYPGLQPPLGRVPTLANTVRVFGRVPTVSGERGVICVNAYLNMHIYLDNSHWALLREMSHVATLTIFQVCRMLIMFWGIALLVRTLLNSFGFFLNDLSVKQ